MNVIPRFSTILSPIRLPACLVLMALLAASAKAQPAVEATTQAPALTYEVEASLLYFDALKRPRTGAISRPELGGSSTTAAAAPARALGLGRLRLVATWQALDSAGLRLVLRPDASNRAASGEARELDTRAGEVLLGSPYRPMPTIRLLDAYQLRLAPGAALGADFGVFEELVSDVGAYPELLGFGLETQFPAKFSGVRLAWRKARAQSATEGDGLVLELSVMQGNEDRAEDLCESSTATVPCGGSRSSFDHAPVARDPYQGAALGASWVGANGLRLAVLGGTLDAAAPDGARASEMLAQVGAELARTTFGRASKLGLDFRYARERWRETPVKVRPRVQYSARLTSAVAVDARSFVVAGVAYGHSDQDPTLPASAARTPDVQVPVDGYQVEAGYLATVAAGLTAHFMLTHEERTMEDATGREVGGILHEEAQSRTLRRMGLGLTYLLNDDA